MPVGCCDEVTAVGTRTVAVAVPLSNRSELTADEVISFRHLERFLGRYDKYLIAPRTLKVSYPGFEIERFDNRYFGSAAAYSRLMLSARFYEAFREYRYVLQYHLDSLVFADELERWCETDLDYIGAPWLNCSDTPFVTVNRVGNGGLSLRKVESFLAVLHSPKYWVEPAEYWRRVSPDKPGYLQLLNLPRRVFKHFRRFNGARWEIARRYLGKRNEDYFWSDDAVRYKPDFKVAGFEEGLRFAFEAAPALSFELNGRKLPFGCHAWPRYDRSFWEPYLLK